MTFVSHLQGIESISNTVSTSIMTENFVFLPIGINARLKENIRDQAEPIFRKFESGDGCIDWEGRGEIGFRKANN